MNHAHGGRDHDERPEVAVDRLSLEIEDGDFFSLLGPSGCGKTTTMRLIAGLERPEEGRIWRLAPP